MTQIEKENLQSEILWAVSKYPAFQRNKIYNKSAKVDDKKVFRRSLKHFLKNEVLIRYRNSKITEKQLYSLMERFQKYIREHHNKVLKKGVMRFGTIQKLVNVYLKSMWIMGLMKEPPHFPIDGIMIKEIMLNSKVSWSTIDKKKYKEFIELANDKARKEKRSLAMWESLTYLKLNKNL